jgi:hypothetical protein
MPSAPDTTAAASTHIEYERVFVRGASLNFAYTRR